MNKRYIIESDFIFKGFRCIGIFGDSGTRCGYVGIPKGHPLYKKDYQDSVNMKLEDFKEPFDKRGIIGILCNVLEGDDKVHICTLFNVHGGITFADGGEDSEYPVKSDLWWLGFDCAHYDDAKDLVTLKKEFDNTRTDLIIKMEEEWPISDTTVRTKEYVVSELKSLVDQIIKYKDIY